MFNIFSGIMAKVATGFAALFGLLLLFTRHQSNKIDSQQEKITDLERKKKIRDKLQASKKAALEKERETIKKAKEDDKEITLGDINNL